MATPHLQAHTERRWIKAPDTAGNDENGSVIVVSYNILASIHIKPRGYPFCPRGFRKVMERHPQLMTELDYHSNADIICFQEVETEYFHQTLLPELRGRGYDGIHHQKAMGVCEGVATFYRTSRFSMEKQQAAHFKDIIAKALESEQLDASLVEAVKHRTQYETPILMTAFRCRKTGCLLSVTNVHLEWKTHIVPDLNTLQACIALHQMKEFSPPNAACILCGDFNHEPDMPGYQLMRDGRLDNQSLQHLRKFPLPLTVNESRQGACLVDVLSSWFCHSCTTMRSAYKTVQGKEPLFTNYTNDYGPIWMEAYLLHNKLDGHIDKQDLDSSSSSPRDFPLSVMDPALNATLAPPCKSMTLDYIWFSSDQLRCLGVEEVVRQDLLLPFWACPNQVFPSDHFLMKAAFSFI